MKKNIPTNKIKVVVIVGPTAVGKSNLAVQLAHQIGGEVISADSRQVYKGLDIGTGKITKREMEGVPHYLLDIEDPKKKFNVTDFIQLGTNAIQYISHNKKVPIICGGTGFYIDSLINGTEFSSVKENPALRAKLQKKTAAQLLTQLEKLDSRRAKTIDIHNKVKLIRAIEIATVLGNVPKIKMNTDMYETLYIGLTLDRTQLRERIMKRLIERLENGMIGEIKNLHKKGLSWKRMDELGLEYRYVSAFVQKKMTREAMIEKLHTEICRYAKRQMTWFKRNNKIEWFAPSDIDKVTKRVQRFLKYNTK